MHSGGAAPVRDLTAGDAAEITGRGAARWRADFNPTPAGFETPGCLRIDYRLPYERNV